MITDTDRLDFLQEQEFTRHVGYSTRRSAWLRVGDGPLEPMLSIHTWCVFPGDDLRESIDRAIRLKAKAETDHTWGPA